MSDDPLTVVGTAQPTTVLVLNANMLLNINLLEMDCFIIDHLKLSQISVMLRHITCDNFPEIVNGKCGVTFILRLPDYLEP